MMTSKAILVFALILASSQLSLSPSSAEQAFTKVFCRGCQSCAYNDQKVFTQETGFFKRQQIVNNPYGINEINVKVDSITAQFQFPGVNASFTMNYVLYTPSSRRVRGVVLYNHPTLFGKLEVPSNQGQQITALAGLYCSQNLAFLVPDYIGYAKNTSMPHPYIIYFSQNIKAATLVLNKILKQLGPLGTRYDLFVAGYSQGSTYSLMFQYCFSGKDCLYQDVALSSFYFLKGVIGLEGAYALDTVVFGFLLENVGVGFRNNQFLILENSLTNFGKPGLLSMTLNSFLTYSKYQGSLADHLQEQFFNMSCTLPLLQADCTSIYGKQVTISEALLNANKTSTLIAMTIGLSAFGKKMNGRTYLSSNRSEYVWMHTNSLMSLSNGDVFNDILTASLKNATLVGKQPTVKTFIFTLEKDSLVSPHNTRAYLSPLEGHPLVTNITFDNYDHEICLLDIPSPVDHNGAQLLANIYALRFINLVLPQ